MPQQITPEEQERRNAGARGELWRVTTYYELDKEKRVLHTDNLYTREMKSFRENVFSIGLLVPFEPSVFRVIPPRCIGDIYITKQINFVE
jgi:hypothetical protein